MPSLDGTSMRLQEWRRSIGMVLSRSASLGMYVYGCVHKARGAW